MVERHGGRYLTRTAVCRKHHDSGNIEPRMKSGVLVVGDLLIDRTWLVGESSTKRLFTPHYAVTPRELVDANKKNDVIGGIGTIARTLTVNDDPKDPRPVYVAGVWNDVVEREMLQLVPPEGALAYAVSDDPTRLGHLHFRRLAPSPVSASMRLRVYAPQFNPADKLEYGQQRYSSKAPACCTASTATGRCRRISSSTWRSCPRPPTSRS